MMKERIRIAIYSRKSKYSDKGDSVKNQIELCLEYINLHYSNNIYDVETIIYEDEGFSGGNFKRPQFQKFIEDERIKPYDILICYRLDRISRNLSDFSSLMDEITKLNTSFISIKEQFDTKSPMGRAMMYIASVFSQLEREVIAERIRDNMMELAKTGTWLGGKPPRGFDAQRYEKVKVCERGSDDLADTKVKKACKLVINDEEMKIVELIFEKYLELKALVKVETYLIQNDIKSEKGTTYTTSTIRKVLINPTYVKNDIDVYNYFKSKGICIFAENDGREKFDGKYGIMPYNRTKDGKLLPIENWVLAVGLHEGIITGEQFVNVQTLLENNKDKKYRAIKDSTRNTVMVGLLKCKECGSYMRPKNGGQKLKDGTISYYYSCTLKEKSRGTKCNSKNVKGDFIDNEIINILKNTFVPNSKLYKELKNMTIEDSNIKEDVEIKKLKKQYYKNKEEINNLINNLKHIDESLVVLVNEEMKKLKKQNDNISEKLKSFDEFNLEKKREEKSISNTAKDILKIIDNCFDIFDYFDLKTKRDILKLFIESVYYDKETQKIEVNLLNSKIEQENKNYLIGISKDFLKKKLLAENDSKCTSNLMTENSEGSEFLKNLKLSTDYNSRCTRI